MSCSTPATQTGCRSRGTRPPASLSSPCHLVCWVSFAEVRRRARTLCSATPEEVKQYERRAQAFKPRPSPAGPPVLPEIIMKPTRNAVMAPLKERLFLRSPCVANNVGRRTETREMEGMWVCGIRPRIILSSAELGRAWVELGR